MIKNILIALLLASALLFALSCKLRKVHKEEVSITKTVDSTHLVKQTVFKVDTGKKKSDTKTSKESTGTSETTVYPTKGKPFTIKNGDTFTGEVDSAKTKKTWHHKSNQVKHREVNAGLTTLQNKTDSTGTRKNIKKKKVLKDTVAEPDLMVNIEIIAVIIIVVGAAYLFWRFKKRAAAAIVDVAKSVV